MYDCGFGDCFCLQEEYVNRPLFIDFGIHSASKKGDKNRIYRNVLDDMCRLVEDGENGIDFLLTHYHADHFSGLMYLIRQRNRCHEFQQIGFENVYIPDVWSIANSRDIVMALLMSYLPGCGGRRMNIFDFLLAICNMGGCIHLWRPYRYLMAFAYTVNMVLLKYHTMVQDTISTTLVYIRPRNGELTF